MINLIGKTVIGNDGFDKVKGKVIGERRLTIQDMDFGDVWIVEYEDGRREEYHKHLIKHESEHKGIGVYWIGEKEEKEAVTFYFDNTTGILQ